MSRIRRTGAALGTTTLIVTASALFAMPGVAAASPVSTACGSSVSGNVGDTVLADPSKLFLLPAGTLPAVNLGSISGGTNTVSKNVVLDLITKVCTVTVTGVTATTDTVGKAVETVRDGATKTTETVREAGKQATDAAGSLLPSGTAPDSPAPGSPAPSPGQESGGSKGTTDSKQREQAVVPQPSHRTVAPGYSSLPYSFGGFAPISSFSSVPYSMVSFNTPPGVRYGTGFADYTPEFGMLGEDGTPLSNSVQNAGRADALPIAGTAGAGLPALLAVLALAGASAALVRTWVLRQSVV